nr:PKD domain-containing protein [uncultured Draconibacterium sp.]
MKILKNSFVFLFVLLFAVACETDEDRFYSLDYIEAPANVNAVFDVTQDNTGLVSIFPNSEGAASYLVEFGDGESVELSTQESTTHIYPEGVYQVGITATGITGLTTKTTKELNVTFKAPENLVVTITKDETNPKIVSVSATATFATVIDVYFGDVEDEEPTHVLPGEAATHTYAEPGDYEVKVIAKSAGAASTAYTETITIDAASDPVNLPINFESYTVNYAFGDFGGVASSVIDNPDANGENTSARVAQSVKSEGAETWGGTLLTLESPIDFSAKQIFKVKTWSPKAGAVVKLKVENLDNGDIAMEVDATTTVANEWEELSFNFSAIDMNNEYQKVVLFFDFGNAGDGSSYYFDDIKLTAAPSGGGPLAGIWQVAPEAGAIGVGPSFGDVSWWANSEADITLRACFFDDQYVFYNDGTFSNVLGADTWVEGWQGGSDACGTPVAPHDGSAVASYTYDAGAGTVTLDGKGAFLGIPKAYNGGELANPADAPEAVTYQIELLDENTMIVNIDIGGGWWRYKLVKTADIVASPVEGTWRVAPEAGSIGVGPGQGDISWWAIDAAGVNDRACFYDDAFVFGANGSFMNDLAGDTWVEGWQGGSDACGMPVAPHDGTNAATYVYNAEDGTITLNGLGAYLGIPKAVNGAELASPAEAPGSVTYIVDLQEDNTVMIVDIHVGGDAWWRFKLVKDGPAPVSPLTGSWSVAPEAASIGVGPGQGDLSWWAIDAAGVSDRACFYDDEYVFGADGSFSNVLGAETWIEGWQGGSDACGTPVAPHDGSNAATYSYDAEAGTITLNGLGAYLGIPKAINGAELSDPANAPESVTYTVELSEDETEMLVDIFVGGEAWWRFKLVKN